MHDVCIVGGGVVGIACLRELTRRGYRCVLLEKNPDFLMGASGGNSGKYVF